MSSDEQVYKCACGKKATARLCDFRNTHTGEYTYYCDRHSPVKKQKEQPMLTKQSIIEIADKLKEKTSFLWSVANLDISDSEKERLKEQLCQKMIVDIDDFMKNKLEEEDQQDDEECDCEHCKGYESFRKLIDQSCDASRVVDNPEEVMKNLLSSIKKIIQ